MRAYLTGVTSTSIWRHYEKGQRSFCGHTLPDGMKKNKRLPAAAAHAHHQGGEGRPRRVGSREELIERGVLDAATSTSWRQCANELFAFGQKRAAERGLILVDTKYELGRSPDGAHRLHRRDPHPRQLALLVRRRLRRAHRQG